MCARAAACRVQRCISGLRKPAASRVDTAEMDLPFLASLAQWSESTGLRSRGSDVQIGHEGADKLRRSLCLPKGVRSANAAGVMPRSVRFRVVHESIHPQRPVGLPVRSSVLQAEEAGSTPARGTTHHLKLFVELTLRGAQTGRNDWAASEPVTDNLFNTCRHSSVGRAPVCRTGGRGVRTRWRRHSLSPGEHHEGRTPATAFETMSKRRKGFPSETQVKRGDRVVHGHKEWGLLTLRQWVAKARRQGPIKAQRAARTHVRASGATRSGPWRRAFPSG